MYRQIKGVCLLSLVCACVLVFTGIAQATGIRLDQGRIRVKAEPGQARSGSVQVTNPTDQPIKVTVEIEDWHYVEGTNGEKEFFPMGTLEDSASKWIAFSPQEMTIAPFGQRALAYTIRVPEKDVEGTYYSVLFFRTIIGTATDEDGASVLIAGRIGTLVYVSVEGTLNHNGRVQDIHVTPQQGSKPATFDIAFENTGNTAITLEGDYLIMSSDGLIQGRGEISPIYTQGGMKASSISEWTGEINPGSYDVVFTLDMGEDKLLVEERKMVIPSA